MIVRDQKDLQGLIQIGKVVANCLQYMLARVSPGLSTYELDKMGAAFLKAAGASPAPFIDYGFPGSTCISLNREAAHGVPSPDKIIGKGDLVNIDVSAVKDGYYGDTGGTVVVAPAHPELEKLCAASRSALNKAMVRATAGSKLNRIGQAIEEEATRSGYTVIRNLCSHGIGRKLHEEPSDILPFFNPLEKRRLQEGMVITIEPFLSTGTITACDSDDGWTLLNKRGCVSAQYEHSIVIRKGSPLILTEADH